MALGKLFGYFRKFAQNFPSQCCPSEQRERKREKERGRWRERDGEREQSFASHVICIVLHPFGRLRAEGRGQLAGCCCCCQQSFMCLLAKYMRDSRQRRGRGERERERGAEILGTWHSGERLEIQLSNLQDITGFPLECTLLPAGREGAVQEEGGRGVADTKILV